MIGDKLSRKNQNVFAGFTLIEILVGLSLFMIVSSVSLGILVSTIGAQRKVQDTERVVDNARFALEAMSKAIRVSDIVTSTSGSVLQITHPTRGAITYSLSGDQRIMEQDGANPPIPMTSSKVGVVNLYFQIDGVGKTDNRQPRVTIILKAQAGSSVINLETTVSQRDLDVQ